MRCVKNDILDIKSFNLLTYYLYLQINFFNKVSGCLCVIQCFGITQDPKTRNYALVLQYMENGDLRSYLKQTVESLTWKQRMDNIMIFVLRLKPFILID